MEIAGVVFRQPPCFSPATGDVSTSRHFQSFPEKVNSGSFRLKSQPSRKSVTALVFSGSGDFSDKSHLQYYSAPRMAVKEKEQDEIVVLKKKEIKKKMKLLKGLSKNLSTFSDMGFGLDPDHGLDHQVKGKMISEATEVLLSQLQKLKAEKMESKRIEKAKKKAAAQMMTECKDSSSSESSSSSSESDCENVVNMKQLKTPKNTVQETQSIVEVVEKVENKVTDYNNNNVIIVEKEVVGSSKKIEVCMGGKCKKSGAAMLLENFQAAVGGEAAVVGCKCMGKCRDGPNVRVRVRGENEVVNGAAGPLCIGVGLEDVDSIVSNFFGGTGTGTGSQSDDILLSPAF